jgi:hypothetical protein
MTILNFIKNIPQYIKKNKYTTLGIFLLIIFLIGLGFMIYWLVGQTGNIPWHKCIVPYVFNNGFTDSEKDTIKKYMNIITQASKINLNDPGIVFIPKTNEIEFITFNKTENTKNCGDSLLSKRLGGQTINLSSNCITERTIIHELLHALGFSHEHARKDRDNYVKINYDNILDESKSQFDINTNVVSDKIILKTDYDYNSIMHYSEYAFSKNELPTIEIKDKDKNIPENYSNKLSDIDKKRLQMYYNEWK